MFCKNCGRELEVSAIFCGNCGVRITNGGVDCVGIDSTTRFDTDEKYRNRVIEKVHKQQDKEYQKRIKKLNNQLEHLTKLREKTRNSILESRWENTTLKSIRINQTEGYVYINGQMYPFTSIKGAEVNMISGSRVIMNQVVNTKTKKHVSLLGGVAGAMIAGPFGAVAGGIGLGKTSGNSVTMQQTNSIPTCVHLGVNVNIDGFFSELVLIKSEIDQSDSVFIQQYQNAQNIVALLGRLAKVPMPSYVPLVDNDQAIIAIDKDIVSIKGEIERAVADMPTYEIPDKYKIK